MIVASLVLILGAVALLVLGLANQSSGLLVGSIGTSLLAAVALVVGVRQAAAARAAADLDEDEQFDDAEGDDWADRPTSRYDTREVEHARAMVPPREPMEREAVERSAPVGVSVPSQPLHDDDLDDEDPPDEPVAQRVTAADAARVARMSTEVLVIDGRPRYHVAGCVHLLGRPYEPLPVSEAVELGFSPCGLCEPDSALLADARRV
ncbi:hypothetical protein [Allorhizocola rhizosphaerae]|uniref:hypothetical protein n=1 Tax=Allorhizocola rhizosphaerae TaxID=1872709 RepID=UPI000E3D5169|nr:hypothetical protein [Allorhizocola rhizosphaerae]